MSNLKTTGDLTLDMAPNLAVVSFQTEPQIVNLANTEIAKSWRNVQINWAYPKGEMLLIVETPFTEKQQPYAISLDKQSVTGIGLDIRRILDDEEIDVLASDCKLVQDSDCNGQVILKFKCVSSNAYLQSLKYSVNGK